jgi:hypothetical protein
MQSFVTQQVYSLDLTHSHYTAKAARTAYVHAPKPLQTYA